VGIKAHRREFEVANVDAIKNKAKGAIIDQIDRRTTDLGNVVHEHVSNLRTMGDSLRGQGQEGTARLVDVAADRLNQVALYLRETDGDRIVHDVETVARNQPVITATAGLLLGMTAARLLKTGAVKRYRTYGEMRGAYGNTSASYGAVTSYGDADSTSTAETYYGVR
jgi:hypothetical protein